MFPIAILLDNATSLSFIQTPEDLPQGKKFTIVLTNINVEKFQLATKVVQCLWQNLGFDRPSNSLEK